MPRGGEADCVGFSGGRPSEEGMRALLKTGSCGKCSRARKRGRCLRTDADRRTLRESCRFPRNDRKKLPGMISCYWRSRHPDSVSSVPDSRFQRDRPQPGNESETVILNAANRRTKRARKPSQSVTTSDLKTPVRPRCPFRASRPPPTRTKGIRGVRRARSAYR